MNVLKVAPALPQGAGFSTPWHLLEQLQPLGWVFFTHSPRSSCLISRLAWEVVNWFTMSSAVWLYVFRMFTSTPPWVHSTT